MLPRGLSDFQTRRFGEALELVEHGAVSSLLLVRLLKRPKVKPSLAAFRKTLLKAYTATSEVFKYYTLEECEEEPLLLYLASAQHRENHLKKLGEKLLLEEELQSVSGVTKTLRNELKRSCWHFEGRSLSAVYLWFSNGWSHCCKTLWRVWCKRLWFRRGRSTIVSWRRRSSTLFCKRTLIHSSFIAGLQRECW